MSTISRVYGWMHDRISRHDEQGEYSAGVWQDAVRRRALAYCRGLSGRILEIGCGEGLFLARLAAAAPRAELYGVDNDAGRLALAEKRFAAKGGKVPHLRVQSAHHLDFSDGYFDTIVCINVVLSMPDLGSLEKILCEMKRLIKTGGRIIFDYRNAANALLVLKYRYAHRYDDTLDHILTTFRPDDIDRLLLKLALAKKREGYIPAFFGHLRWLRHVAPVIVLETEKV